MSTVAKNLLLTAFVLLIQACMNDAKKTDDSEAKGIFQKSSIWPTGEAQVCFADLDLASSGVREKINAIVDSEINQKTRFRFSGFELCSQTSTAVLEVQILAKGRSNAGGIGDSRNIFTSLLPHFIPANRLRQPMHMYLSMEGNKSLTEVQFHNIVVHEFGHALGLLHEQIRNDSTCADSSGGKGEPSGSVAVGKYDPDSVMNYCHPNFFLKRFSLSSADVATINSMYFKSEHGGNAGTQLRCEKSSLTSCVKGNGGESCLVNFCRGGEYICTKASALKSCIHANGGSSCLGAEQGNCRG